MRWSEEERRSQYAEVFLMEEDIEISDTSGRHRGARISDCWNWNYGFW